jgi:hypothetical protein
MLFLVLTLLVPFAMFVGGSFYLNYPVTLGLLYGFNFILMYIVLWKVIGQIIEIHTQKMSISNGNLILTREQLNTSFPLICRADLIILISAIKVIHLIPTRIGYLLKVRFEEEDKIMGIDLDINPLHIENKEVLLQAMALVGGLQIDSQTQEVLDSYNKKLASWKGNYVVSLALIAVALVMFLAVSLFLGMNPT